MSVIKKIIARQIFDSRGNPTVEVDVITENGIVGRAAVPSGASTGQYEAVELRDAGENYCGKGVLIAVSNVNDIIAKELIGKSIFNQRLIDNTMVDLDGTENKSVLGANAILGVSLAVAKAAAKEKNMSIYAYLGGDTANILPVPMMNIINGGSHSDAPIAFQEFMIIPVLAKNFSHAMQMGTEIFHSLKKVLTSRNLTTSVGDEGGFAPKLDGTEDALETIKKAITNVDLKGRLQEIKHGKLKEYAKNNRLIVDGGHNLNAANSLVKWIETLNEDVHLILGMMKDKDHQEYVNTFKGKIKSLTLIDIPNQKGTISKAVIVRKRKEGVLIADFLSEKGIDIISSESLLIHSSDDVRFILDTINYCLSGVFMIWRNYW